LWTVFPVGAIRGGVWTVDRRILDLL
jgi:hypothetical protein